MTLDDGDTNVLLFAGVARSESEARAVLEACKRQHPSAYQPRQLDEGPDLQLLG